ncbi:MAG: nitroreductase family protein [Armatimonadetes bacterium]|nr:nitroreductase family protein [Armatimonadota bacterium]
MDVTEAIRTRRSVRRYSPEPLEPGTLDALLDAAVQAPSGMNTQPWAFGLVEGADAIRHLGDRAKAHLLASLESGSPLEALRDRLVSPDFNIFYGAPALIVIYVRPAVTAAVDGALAAQNVMLAAHAMGLGTCWIGLAHGFLDSPEAKAEFGVPEDCRVSAPLIAGRPAGPTPPVPRKAPEVLFRR